MQAKGAQLPYSFFVQYNQGKWRRGPDTFSCNPVKVCGNKRVELKADHAQAYIETIVIEK